MITATDKMIAPGATNAEAAPFESTFLPDFCSTRIVFLAVIGAELLAFILTLGSGATGETLWIKFALVSLFVQWIALGNMLLLCLCRPKLRRLSPLTAAASCYSLSLLVTLATSFCAVQLTPMELTMLGGGFSLQEDFILRNLLISAVVSAVTLRYFYMQHQWKQNVVIEARSRIQALQARIRPHFLFNSMNTIASLTRTSPALAEKAVEDLADLFRASLGHQDTVKLDEELEFTRRYINIEELRLGERLKIDWQIDDHVHPDAKVPALILQPLMENAIYHGIEPLPAGGVVNLSITQDRGRLQFSISNPLPAQRAYQQRSGNKMAQDNIRQRLKLAYGDNTTMDIHKTNDRYTVSFSIPVEVQS